MATALSRPWTVPHSPRPWTKGTKEFGMANQRHAAALLAEYEDHLPPHPNVQG